MPVFIRYCLTAYLAFSVRVRCHALAVGAHLKAWDLRASRTSLLGMPSKNICKRCASPLYTIFPPSISVSFSPCDWFFSRVAIRSFIRRISAVLFCKPAIKAYPNRFIWSIYSLALSSGISYFENTAKSLVRWYSFTAFSLRFKKSFSASIALIFSCNFFIACISVLLIASPSSYWSTGVFLAILANLSFNFSCSSICFSKRSCSLRISFSLFAIFRSLILPPPVIAVLNVRARIPTISR